MSKSADGAVQLLFVRDGTLLAQALDLTSMVAFRAPDPQPGGGVPTWFERDGRRAGPVFSKPIPPILFPQLSPDGTRLAAIVDRSLWVYPLDGRPPVRLTSGGSLSPLWSSDGQSIVYERYGAVAGLHVTAADESSSIPRAVGPPGHFHAHGFIDGGRGVLAIFEPPQSVGSWSLVRVPSSGTEAPVRLGDIVLPTPSASAALSPDGRWLAYIANTIGQRRIVGATLPEPRRRSKYAENVRREGDALLAALHRDSAKQGERLESLMRLMDGGDIRRGQAVFNSEKAACASCHAIGYLGGRIGPDLTRIGEVRSERDLLESIVFQAPASHGATSR